MGEDEMLKFRSGSKGLVVAAGMLLAVGLMIPVAALAQSSPPDSSAAAKPDSVAVTPAPAAVAPAAAAPAAAAPASAAPAKAAPAQNAGMFSQGQKRVTGVVGWGHTFGQDYLLVGVGVGYFIRNGLDVGVDFEGWFGGDPQLYKISPRFDYVLWKPQRIKPYVGGFYRYNFVGGNKIDDTSSLGGRIGAFYKGSGRGMAGAGAVYERYLNCDESVFSSCDVVYPEVFVAVSF
jgi:hypothetical protein